MSSAATASFISDDANNRGIKVDAMDIGEEIGRLVLGRVDGVDTQRAIFEKGNWPPRGSVHDDGNVGVASVAV